MMFGSLGQQFDFGEWSTPPPPAGPVITDLPATPWVAPPSKEATAAYIAKADPRTAVPLLSSQEATQILCTQEAMVCPDGSTVGRTGPNCEFAPCPTSWEGIPEDWWNTDLLSFPPWAYLLVGGGILWLMTRK